MARGLAIGINKGHVVTSIEVPSWAPGKNPRKRVSLIRRVIREITGKAPYERKIIELLKQKKANSSKKAYKMAKKSLGTHKRAQKKRNELAEFLARGH
jgi:large subunit ribosomal protein L36e